MSRRSDQLAREAQERLATVAAQLGAARARDAGGWVPTASPDADEPSGPLDLLPEAPGRSDAPLAQPPDTSVGTSVRTSPEVRVGAHRARRRAGGGRLAVSRPAVAGLVVVALLAAALAAGLMWRARPVPVQLVPARASDLGGTPEPRTTVTSARAVPGVPGPGTTGPASSPSPSGLPVPTAGAATVLVHVVGQVRHPGLVHLPAGARVDDAVRAAGGATARADLSAINLARVLTDGEQVRVPAPGEAVPPPVAGADGPGGAPAGAAPSAPLDLNAATLTELDALPGVGPVLAQRILEWRSEHTRFSSVDELREVRGIGDKVFADLRPLVRV